MSAWLALVVAGVLTWAAKAAPSTVGARLRLPPTIERAGALIGPALLGALAARGFAAQAARGDGVAVLAAAVVAVPVAVWTRSITVTVATGLGGFLLVVAAVR